VTDLADITPAKGDRVFAAGQTGSGKTTLMRVLLQSRAYVVVIDGKGTLNWPEYKLVRTVDDCIRLGRKPLENPRIIVRPDYKSSRDPTVWDQLFRWVYLRGCCTVYVDETYAVTNGNDFPEWYGACLTRGRESDVEVWSASQRPKDIPQIAMSEAEHVYAFYLKMPQDRQKLEAFSGVEAERVHDLRKRQFLYVPQEGETMGPFQLSLHGLVGFGPQLVPAKVARA
jgi:hypothetical protein